MHLLKFTAHTLFKRIIFISKTTADAEAYKVVAAARAAAESTRIDAEARAEATLILAKARAEAIRLQAEADAAVTDQFAREMMLRRNEVDRVGAFGNKTVFVSGEGLASQAGSAMTIGLAEAKGAQAAQE